MKYSNYNSILSLTEHSCLLYNAFSDEFIIFRRNLSDVIAHMEPAEVAESYPDFYSKMLSGGAIIDDERNELNELREQSNRVDHIMTEYQLFINPTMNCNFRCWYCYETHEQNSKITPEILDRIEKLISNILVSNPGLEHFHISFFGGEPLLYYKQSVEPIIDYLTDACRKREVSYHISFTTNGFLIDEKKINHLKKFSGFVSFQITLDGHREQHNKVRFTATQASSYDVIISNLKKLVENDFRVILRVNYTSDNLFSVKNIMFDIEDIPEDKRGNMRISFHRVWQDHQVKKEVGGRVDDTIDLFRGKFNVVAAHYELDDLKYPCYADKKNEAVINYNGDVFKCTARDFLMENRCGILSEEGQIVWKDEYLSRSMSVKIQKKVCEDCRILPLCGGGCSQKSLESSGRDTCISKYKEYDKDQIILYRFYNRFVKKGI